MFNARAYLRNPDYDKVGSFLVDTFVPGYKSTNWLQARWEYMHFHPALNIDDLNRFGIWEDAAGCVIGVVHYEYSLGQAYFQLHPEHSYLKKEMLAYAEENLYAVQDNGKKKLRLFIDSRDQEMEALAAAAGYIKSGQATEPMAQFDICCPFGEVAVPEGFRLQTLQEENDLHKVNRVLWRGFNHPGEPPEEEIDGRRLMQSAPNYNKEITVVTVAPDGSYASFAGNWFDPVHKIAYIEPVATDPDYRMKGLGKAAVLEGIRRCGNLGAKVVYVGSSQPFYLTIGFAVIFEVYTWTKEF